jgi:L-fucose mutarotase/ribose pyranase (RbsD/FucU family)
MDRSVDWLTSDGMMATCCGTVERLERFDFYRLAHDAFGVAVTGERRLYANLTLRKGLLISSKLP